MPRPERQMGRPFVWPWLTTPVGRSFILTIGSKDAAIASASRVKRHHGVQYTTTPMTSPAKFKMTRVR
jgi:hypothetical protein